MHPQLPNGTRFSFFDQNSFHRVMYLQLLDGMRLPSQLCFHVCELSFQEGRMEYINLKFPERQEAVLEIQRQWKLHLFYITPSYSTV